MIDLTQLLLMVVVLIVTALLTVLGVQVYFILKEFRITLQKANKVLDDTGTISESVSKPISMLSSVAMGIRGGTAIVKALTKKRGKA